MTPQGTRIHSFIQQEPGASTRAVAVGTDMDETTADYHLWRLVREGAVVGGRHGRTRAWFAAGSGFCPVLQQALPAFRLAHVPAVAAALDETPRTAMDVAKRSSVPVGQVRWAAQRLKGSGITAPTPTGRLRLAEGARMCVAMASSRKRCDQWGACPMSQSVLTSSCPSRRAR